MKEFLILSAGLTAFFVLMLIFLALTLVDLCLEFVGDVFLTEIEKGNFDE